MCLSCVISLNQTCSTTHQVGQVYAHRWGAGSGSIQVHPWQNTSGIGKPGVTTISWMCHWEGRPLGFCAILHSEHDRITSPWVFPKSRPQNIHTTHFWQCPETPQEVLDWASSSDFSPQFSICHPSRPPALSPFLTTPLPKSGRRYIFHHNCSPTLHLVDHSGLLTALDTMASSLLCPDQPILHPSPAKALSHLLEVRDHAFFQRGLHTSPRTKLSHTTRLK
jgi:hypothetical protein